MPKAVEDDVELLEVCRPFHEDSSSNEIELVLTQRIACVKGMSEIDNLCGRDIDPAFLQGLTETDNSFGYSSRNFVIDENWAICLQTYRPILPRMIEAQRLRACDSRLNS